MPAKRDYTLVPLGFYVALEVQKETKSGGGLYLPDKVDEGKEKKCGVVVAVGEGEFQNGALLPIPLKVGDWVMCTPGRGTTCTLHKAGKTYVLINWREILFALRDGQGHPLKGPPE